MSREIKFRVWDTAHEDMTYFDFNGIDDDGYVSHTASDSGGYPFTYKCDAGDIMQYTGKKDHNNKEIYEGDIVKTPLGHICLIKWGHVSIVVHEDRFEYTGFIAEYNGANFHFDRTICNGEVLGNIYENPELLEATHD